MKKVYVISPREGLDYSGAKEFGEVELWLGNTSPFALSNIKASATKLADFLMKIESACEDDGGHEPPDDITILFFPGLTATIFMMYLVAFASEIPEIKVLLFNSAESRYEPRIINLIKE